MPIIIEGQTLGKVPKTVESLYDRFPSLKHDATKFATRPCVKVDISVERALYVTQKEYVVVDRNDERIDILGSDDATTCHIVVIENPTESTICLAHIDSASNLESLMKMVIDIMGNSTLSSTVLELSLFGGYDDENGISKKLTKELLAFFHHLPIRFSLKSACIGSVNTVYRDGINWPIIYGIFVSRSTFSISPASFDLNARGPCLALRSARFFCSAESLYRVYHSEDGKFQIEPFDYQLPQRLHEWLHKSDDYVRNNFSTSPAVEPSHFSQEIKQVFLFVAQNPFPMHSIFKSKRPVEFQLSPSTGKWSSM